MTETRLLKLVGKRIRQLRVERGLTQEQMTRFGLDYKYYQRIEYGQKNLSLRTLYKIAKAFDISISELLNID
jgi:transcriptional regulator with XRE-family HTH domain